MVRRLAVVACTLLSGVALADTYDFHLIALGNPQPGGTGYSPRADANFRVFARQFAAGMTSVNLAPPDTLGHSGFAFSGELSIVSFGTTDVQLPTEGEFRGPLLIPTVHVRKGLPWSFELGARGGWIEKSRMGVATLELKWSVNEGFTYLPDVGVRGSVTKLVNSRDFDLTAGGIDIGIGKQFALGGMVTLTPYVGWNLVFVGASTGNIDFHPSRTLVDADSSSEVFRDFYVFTPLQAAANSHNRFYGGVRFIGGVVMLGGEVSYSVLGKFHDCTPVGTCAEVNEDRLVPAVLAINTTIGLDF